MKTRIVYPQLWHDSKFCESSTEAKALFMFLVTNPYLGLSRYNRVSDRQISFHTGLTGKKLLAAKDELSALNWCFFEDEWVFHNHECAYVDYNGSKNSETAKEKEIANVPENIRLAFDQSVTGPRPNINKKQETINKKLEIKGESAERGMTTAQYRSPEDLKAEDFEEIAQQYQVPVAFVMSKLDDMLNWLEKTGKTYKNYKAALRDWVKRDAIKQRTERRASGNLAIGPNAN